MDDLSSNDVQRDVVDSIKGTKKLEVKAKSTLMMGISNKHQLKFNSIKDAKQLLEAVEKRFDGNAATKKTQRNLLKQQFKKFSASSSEMLDQTFDRLQKLNGTHMLSCGGIKQIWILQAWMISITTLSINEVVTANGVSTTSTQVNAVDNLSDVVICAFLASQPNSPQLANEDLEKIHPDDIEEMDLRWQMAMLTMRSGRQKKDLTMHSWLTYLQVLTQIKNNDAPIIEEWVSDDEEKNVTQSKIVKKIVKPIIVKKEFVKPSQQEKTARKTVKKVEHNRQNTHRPRGKFDGKADERFFVGYSLNSKAFRVFNSRIRIVEENLHIRFSESTTNVVGTQSNDFVGTKASDNAGQARKKTKPADEDPRKENEGNDQEKEDNINSTNNVNTVSSTVNVVGTNEDNKLSFNPTMLTLEDVGTFNFSNEDEDDGEMADMSNLETTIQMSSMGELTFFLGLQVKQKNDGIFISQDKYVAKILKKFGYTEVKNASTSVETQKPMLKDEDGEEIDVHMYRSMIGSLMYLTSSRLDIMIAVCACARYQVNPKVSHLHAMKRIF
nr:uncharacterized mitochondrial protein AtMg00810-like [Tanacetum cinerariifolium]